MKKLANILFGVFLAIEVILMVSMNYLEKLAYKKAGVNHHIYFKKVEYTRKYLTPENIKLITIIVIVLIVLYLIITVKAFRNSRKTLAFASLLAIVWSGVLIYALYSTSISEKLIYPYLILALIVCIAFSTINTIINIIINKKYLHKD